MAGEKKKKKNPLVGIRQYHHIQIIRKSQTFNIRSQKKIILDPKNMYTKMSNETYSYRLIVNKSTFF